MQNFLEAFERPLMLEICWSSSLRWPHSNRDSLHHAKRFKALANAIVAQEIAAPRHPDKIEQAVSVYAAISEDLGDAEL